MGVDISLCHILTLLLIKIWDVYCELQKKPKFIDWMRMYRDG